MVASEVKALAAQTAKATEEIGAIHAENVFFVLLNISQSGTELQLDGRYCDRTEINPQNALVPVIVPAAWAHTEKMVHRKGTFTAGTDGVSTLAMSEYVELAGALPGPATDPLPKNASELSALQVIDEETLFGDKIEFFNK